MAFDDRIVRVTFEDNGKTDIFEDLYISVTGQSTASYIGNQATVTIINVNETTRSRLATKYTPINMLQNRGKRGTVTIEIGRQSYGTFVLFKGSVNTIALTNPPDIGLIINIIAKYFDKSEIVPLEFGKTILLSELTNRIAKNLNLHPVFNATDKTISNAYYNGDKLNQIRLLSSAGFIQAFIDKDQLIVIDDDKPRYSSSAPIEITVNNGMIGVPHWNESGVQFRILARPDIQVGDFVSLTSIINPSVNDGIYKVVNLLFNVANRDTPFYYDIFCTRVPQ